jgi:hypothetical protein
MPDLDREVPSYIGRERCGCVVAAVVDDGKNPGMVKRALKEFVEDELIIERVTVGWVRDNGFKKCEEHNVKQLPLITS